MAMPGTMQDPLKPVKDKLSDIEKKIDNLPKNGDSSLDADIKAIREDIASLANSLKDIVGSMETDEVREQKQKEMERNIMSSLNSNINTQMGNIKDDLKKTNFSVTLREDQLQIFREFLKALSPEARTELGEFLDKHVKQLNDVATIASKENLQQSLRDSSKEWVKSYKDTLKKEVENTYEEVEKKRKQEGKVMVMPASVFYVIIIIAELFFCFGLFGMSKLLDLETFKWSLLALGGGGIFIGCLWMWMKFKDWRDNRRYRY